MNLGIKILKMKKIKKTELETLQELQTKQNNIYANIANLEILKTKLLKENETFTEEMQQFISKLEEKYGKVNISLKDGSISEVEEE
jgi:seryl-tRNA synthetase